MAKVEQSHAWMHLGFELNFFGVHEWNGHGNLLLLKVLYFIEKTSSMIILMIFLMLWGDKKEISMN